VRHAQFDLGIVTRVYAGGNSVIICDFGDQARHFIDPSLSPKCGRYWTELERVDRKLDPIGTTKLSIPTGTNSTPPVFTLANKEMNDAIDARLDELSKESLAGAPMVQQMTNEERDNINKPAHYTATKIEPIDVIETWGLGFHLGNCVKYIARHGKKDPSKTLEDLLKAQFYLNKHIENLKKK
jgi:hypothetical protein